jgi:hypothetical protein
MREGHRQGLAERVEPGIDGRRELLVTGEGQVHLKRRLVQDTVEAPVEINERPGRFQALDAPSQLSHTSPCCASNLLLHSGPEGHGLTVLPRFRQ